MLKLPLYTYAKYHVSLLIIFPPLKLNSPRSHIMCNMMAGYWLLFPCHIIGSIVHNNNITVILCYITIIHSDSSVVSKTIVGIIANVASSIVISLALYIPPPAHPQLLDDTVPSYIVIIPELNIPRLYSHMNYR